MSKPPNGDGWYKVDTNLADSETFFNDNRGGIVPLAAAIPYFERATKEMRNLK